MPESAVRPHSGFLMLLAFLVLLTIRPVSCEEGSKEWDATEKSFGPSFVACSVDQDTTPDLATGLTNIFEMTLEKCRGYCKTLGTTYMGLRDEDVCTCGKTYGQYGLGTVYDCITPCQGDRREKCGGHLYNAVYKV